MKKFIALFTLLPALCLAAPPNPWAFTVDVRRARSEKIKAFQANQRTFDIYYKDSGNALDLTGITTSRFSYADGVQATQYVPASTTATIDPTGGVVRYTFSATDLNTNGNFIWETYLEDSNGAPITIKQGPFEIVESPVAVGVAPAPFTNLVNLTLFGFQGLKFEGEKFAVHATNDATAVQLSATGGIPKIQFRDPSNLTWGIGLISNSLSFFLDDPAAIAPTSSFLLTLEKDTQAIAQLTIASNSLQSQINNVKEWKSVFTSDVNAAGFSITNISTNSLVFEDGTRLPQALNTVAADLNTASNSLRADIANNAGDVATVNLNLASVSNNLDTAIADAVTASNSLQSQINVVSSEVGTAQDTADNNRLYIDGTSNKLDTAIADALTQSNSFQSQINALPTGTPLYVESDPVFVANGPTIAYETNENVYTVPQTIRCLHTNITKFTVSGPTATRFGMGIGPTNQPDLSWFDVLNNGTAVRWFVNGQFGDGIILDSAGGEVRIARLDLDVADGEFRFAAGASVSNLATSITDNDKELPTSGAVVEYVTTNAPYRVIDDWSDHDTRITNTDEPPVYWQGTIYELDTADVLVNVPTTNTIANGYNRHVVLNITHVVSTGAVVFTGTKVNESTGESIAPFSETVNVAHAIGATNVYIQSPSKLLNDVDYYAISGGAFTADVYTTTYKDYWNRDFKVKNLRIGALARNATWDFNTELFIVHNDGSTTDLLSNRLDFASTDGALRLDAQTPGNGKISDFADILIKGSEAEGIVFNFTGSSSQGGPDDIQGLDMSMEIEIHP